MATVARELQHKFHRVSVSLSVSARRRERVSVSGGSVAVRAGDTGRPGLRLLRPERRLQRRAAQFRGKENATLFHPRPAALAQTLNFIGPRPNLTSGLSSC